MHLRPCSYFSTAPHLKLDSVCALAGSLNCKQRQDFLGQVKERQDGLGQRSRPEEAAGEDKSGEREGGQAGEGGEGDVFCVSTSIFELVFVFGCECT